MGTRRQARESALAILYASDVGAVPVDTAKRHFWSSFTAGDDPWAVLKDDTALRAFSDSLLSIFDGRHEEVDEKIRSVSQHWRLERMTPVDRNILRLATCELLDDNEVPPRVTLNEAVELAKKFGAEGSSKFVNGVLDRIASDLPSG